MILGVCRRVLGGDAQEGLDAEDAAQESMLALLRALDGGVRVDNLSAFARTVAVRTSLNVSRSRRRERARRSRAAAQSAAEPGHPVRRSQLADVLMHAIAELPENQAEAVTLRLIFNYSISETAAATDVSNETVRSRLRLARQKLRKTLAEDPVVREEMGTHE
jgi:RNA polymerase sigma-70 factor (ECF subfamily)